MGAWEDAKASAMARANATSALLDRNLGSADLNREVQAQRSFGTAPLRPTAPTEVNFQDLGQKMPDSGHTVPTETDLHSQNNSDFGSLRSLAGYNQPNNVGLDLGEKAPGSTKAQSLRGRAIARSMMAGKSSGKSATSTDPKGPAPAPKTKAADFTTDTGEEAGAIKTMSPAPKDLGRVTGRVMRGNYGELSTKTASQVKGSFLSRAADSVSKGIGDTLGSYGALSLAAKASSAYQGMKQGQSVNPLTLDTSTPAEGTPVLTPTGMKKAPKPPVSM